MYSMRASPFNGAKSVYGAGMFPVRRNTGAGMFPVGGAMYGGFAPGSDMTDWYDLLKAQRFYSLKKKLNGLTTAEKNLRKYINGMIMTGTMERNAGLRAARKYAALPGNFNYRSKKPTPHYFSPADVAAIIKSRGEAWNKIKQPTTLTGDDIKDIMDSYRMDVGALWNAAPTDMPDDWTAPDWKFNPEEYADLTNVKIAKNLGELKLSADIRKALREARRRGIISPGSSPSVSDDGDVIMDAPAASPAASPGVGTPILGSPGVGTPILGSPAALFSPGTGGV